MERYAKFGVTRPQASSAVFQIWSGLTGPSDLDITKLVVLLCYNDDTVSVRGQGIAMSNMS